MKKKMTKQEILVVVDTNVFINCFLGKGRFKDDEKVLEYEDKNEIKLVTSSYTQNELFRILSREIHLNNLFECKEIYFETVKILERNKFIDTPLKTKEISIDKTDQGFIDLAVHAKASFLVTNDRKNGMLDLKNHEGVKIVTPKMFDNTIKRQLRKKR